MKRSFFVFLFWLFSVNSAEGSPKFGAPRTKNQSEGWRRTGTADLYEMNIFYDPKTRSSFRITSIENNLINPVESSDQSLTKSGKMPRRIGYRANGCNCQELTCGCCLGINMDQFNFNREGCMNFTYLPEDFAISMNMIMDNESIYQNALSAKNPPPLCIPLAIPGVPISLPIDFCARVYDIYTQDRNIHMCFDLEARFSKAEILILHFDCMVMGSQGLVSLSPGEPIPTSSTMGPIDTDYDTIYEKK
ncbi:uncharacterized protein LOC123321707 [Coccinella septempunctata]|uniref:uncharacterized protein LOC123321707 n=1 Tax=Coccinella septempunctata TaxID=41139 RepID=UPI001D0619D7|nr:uncharacterized protein LOC123321707 [Coccinella septempunctata]